MYGQRPSALLGVKDEYVAYCVDEAGAWLLSQSEPPAYGGKQRLNGNDKLMAALASAGAAKIKE